MRHAVWLALLTALPALALPAPEPPAAPVPFVFRDVGDETGLAALLAGSRGHAAAWGDYDGDGWPDLFVGTFANAGKPGQLLRNVKGKFVLDKQVSVTACASGAAFADLGNAGRLDLFVANNAHGKAGVRSRPSVLYRNDGAGKLVDVSKDSGACPPGFLSRSVACADLDGDGRLDLLVAEYYYSAKAPKGVALYRNLGGHRFTDVAGASGLPLGGAVVSVAVADFNNDGWPDVFLTRADGDNRLYLNDGKGGFREAPGTRQVFAWKGLGTSDVPAGVAVVDVNRDGLPDIVIGNHFKTPWLAPAPVRLYLCRGIRGGVPVYEDVTEAAGLGPLAMKAPHVELQDFDNDGWPDLFVSIVKFRDGKPYPIVYRNLGCAPGGVPRFRESAWGVNDFPTPADRAIRGTTKFFAKMVKEKKVWYAAAAPAADFDRDGRIDLLLVPWWEELRPLLLRNETPGGNWLDVRVAGRGKVNPMGVGARVSVWPAGKLGEMRGLVGCREIAVGQGWCSGQEAVAHFGLGPVKEVDLEVVLPHGNGKVVRRGVKVNQRLTVPAVR
jgi:hypothetical protein